MTLSRLVALPLVALTGACVLPLDEGRAFRQRLAGMTGQSVSLLFEEIGPGDPEETESGRGYTWQWLTIGYGRPSGDCSIAVEVDDQERITAARMDGSDYICGNNILGARAEAARHRADPTLRARAEARSQKLLQELVRLRREISSGDDD